MNISAPTDTHAGAIVRLAFALSAIAALGLVSLCVCVILSVFSRMLSVVMCYAFVIHWTNSLFIVDHLNTTEKRTVFNIAHAVEE